MPIIKHLSIIDTPIYLVGNLLGNYEQFKENLVKLDIVNACIIFLGDLSFNNSENFYNHLENIDKELSSRNIDAYIVRGNRDNPFLWKNKTFWSKFFRLRPIDSTTKLDFNGNIGIVIEGATTIDRNSLINGVDYWLDYDKPIYPPDFIDYGENRKKVDFVIGHGGPVLSDFFKDKDDKEKYLKHGFFVENLAEEQKIYRQILQRYRPKRWYCGHYNIDLHTKFVWDNWSDDGVIDLRVINKQKIERIA